MRNLINTLALIIATAVAGNAQTIYNITKNTNISTLKLPSSQLNNAVVNISEGVTLTINNEIGGTNMIFNGGTLAIDKPLTIWQSDKNEFNNVIVEVKNKSSFTTSGTLAINKSTFTFYGNSTGTFWAPTTVNASKITFLDNSGSTITKTFNMQNNSSMVAGDGTTTSKAYIKFDGGTLNEYDNSFISVQNYNNYYHNWSAYNSISNNKSYTTTNNNMNCGNGKNKCEAQFVYGPSTLNFAGVASSAVLPVKLSAFAVKMNGASVNITWATAMEMNADRFEIERSIDGINWSVVATVASKVNSTTTVNYSYTDVVKLSGNISYRLKMIDQDATFSYSAIRTVKAEGSVEMSIYPNPATNYVVIRSSNNNAKNVQLINQNGQVVKQANGNNNINLSVTEFNTGNYYVRVSDANGAAQTFKLMIAK